jgi:hypothetical protein
MLRTGPRWSSRESFLASQIADLDGEWSNFIEDDGGARRSFLDLAGRTFDELGDRRQTVTRRSSRSGEISRESPIIMFSFRAWPDCGGFALNVAGLRSAASPGLLAGWDAWRMGYADLEARNPRLALANDFQRMSESDLAMSWPSGKEEALQDWVDEGLWFEPPFRDSHGIVTPDFHTRLQSLRRRIAGWLWWDPEQPGKTYLTEAEWQATRASLASQRLAGAAVLKAATEAGERYRKAERHVVHIARGDTAMWDELLAIERRLELVAQSRPRHPKTVQLDDKSARPGPLKIEVRALSPEESAARDAVSFSKLDPALRAIVDRLAPLAPELTPFKIAIALRSSLRRNLGFTKFYSLWTPPPPAA